MNRPVEPVTDKAGEYIALKRCGAAFGNPVEQRVVENVQASIDGSRSSVLSLLNEVTDFAISRARDSAEPIRMSRAGEGKCGDRPLVTVIPH